VIPAYRAARTLRRAVDSVRGADVRVIAVFDGPDPEAEAAIADRADVVVYRRAEQGGAPACRNLGLALADATFVLFLDADDYIEGPLLAEAARAAAEADLVFAPFAFEYPDGSRQICDPRLRYRATDAETVTRAWLAERYTPPCAVLWRADFLRGLGGWDEALAKNQDGDLVYRALARRPRVALSIAGLGVYVQDDDPQRITRRHDRRCLASQMRVLDRVRATMTDCGYAVGAELGRAYYSLARLCYTHEVDDLGRAAETAARTLGVSGNPGGLAHRTVADVLGLRAKQRLARAVREAAAMLAATKERLWSPFSSASTGAPAPSAPISPMARAVRSKRSPRERARSL
jgi:glycosyltransferase involved in cell wall biosynthesis